VAGRFIAKSHAHEIETIPMDLEARMEAESTG
jgi:hypothetical protein